MCCGSVGPENARYFTKTAGMVPCFWFCSSNISEHCPKPTDMIGTFFDHKTHRNQSWDSFRVVGISVRSACDVLPGTPLSGELMCIEGSKL